MQTKEKAPQLGAMEPNQLATAGDGQRQTGHSQTNGQAPKSSNGSNATAQREIRSGPITKVIRYSDLKFVQVLQDTVRDNRLSFGARGLLNYILSHATKRNWQPLSWQIKQETGCSEYELRSYMKELRRYGYARLVGTKRGQR